MMNTKPPGARIGQAGCCLALLLTACGGGNGDGSGGAPGIEGGNGSEDTAPPAVTIDDGESATGDSTVSDGAPPVVPLADVAARALLIDVAELTDAMQFLAASLPTELALPPGECEGGGTRTAVTGTDGAMTFDDCALSMDDTVRLNGTAAFSPTEVEGSDRLMLDGLQAFRGAFAVTSDGALTIATRDDALMLSLEGGASLQMDDSQGTFAISDLSARLPRQPGGGPATIAYAVSSSRADTSATVSTEEAFGFSATPGCPDSGAIVLTLDDGRTLRLIGSPGQNVSLDGDTGMDTLDCGSIGSLLRPVSTGSPFTPPPAPGG